MSPQFPNPTTRTWSWWPSHHLNRMFREHFPSDHLLSPQVARGKRLKKISGCKMQHCSWFSLKRFSPCLEDFWWLGFWLGCWNHLELVVWVTIRKVIIKNPSSIQIRCLLHTWTVKPHNYSTLKNLISHNWPMTIVGRVYLEESSKHRCTPV